MLNRVIMIILFIAGCVLGYIVRSCTVDKEIIEKIKEKKVVHTETIIEYDTILFPREPIYIHSKADTIIQKDTLSTEFLNLLTNYQKDSIIKELQTPYIAILDTILIDTINLKFYSFTKAFELNIRQKIDSVIIANAEVIKYIDLTAWHENGYVRVGFNFASFIAGAYFYSLTKESK